MSSGNDFNKLKEKFIDDTLNTPTNNTTIIDPVIIAGCFNTSLLAFAQNPCFDFFFSFTCGINGQNAFLPMRENIVGIYVNLSLRIKTTAMDNIGTK